MIPESFFGCSVSITRVMEHGPLRRSLYVKKPFHIQPGQFLMMWLPGVDEKPFSVSELNAGEMEITICDVGPTSHALLRCAAGDVLGLRGPFGSGFRLEAGCLLLGGGMGAAPIRYLSRELQRRGLGGVTLIGARSADQLIFADDFVAQGARLFTEDDTGHGLEQGLVTDSLPALLAAGGVSTVCACGPEAMLVSVKNICKNHGVDYQLALERYMKCGMGICGSCSLDGSGIRLCVEGPVLGPHALDQVTELGLPHRGGDGVRKLGNVQENP